MSEDSVPVLALDVRVRNHRGTLVVGRAEHTYELSDTAATVWRLIDGRHDVGSIARRVAADYGVPVEAVIPDVLELLSELASWGAVELS